MQFKTINFGGENTDKKYDFLTMDYVLHADIKELQQPLSDNELKQIDQLIENNPDTADDRETIIDKRIMDRNNSKYIDGTVIPIDIGGYKYRTIEHYYHAQKFMYSDKVRGLHWWVLNAKTGKEAMRRACTDKNILRTDPKFNSMRIPILKNGILVRFRHPELMKKLLDTGDARLEDVAEDLYFGACLSGKGENRYGKLLEDVRLQLRMEKLKGANSSTVAPLDYDSITKGRKGSVNWFAKKLVKKRPRTSAPPGICSKKKC